MAAVGKPEAASAGKCQAGDDAPLQHVGWLTSKHAADRLEACQHDPC